MYCTFYFFGSLLRFREVSSTTFCIVERTLCLLYPFSGVHLGTPPLEKPSSIYIYKLLASRITSYIGIATKLLRTESLLLLGNDSTIFQRVKDR